jgi:hypothetical protein
MKGTINRVLLVTAATVAIGATPATAQPGQESSLSKVCPDGAAAQCQKPPLPLGGKKQQRPSIRPHAVIDSRGQPAWRSGTWLMY